MKRSFLHSRQTVSITHNEDKQRYDWQIEKAQVGGHAPEEWLAEYIALVAAEELDANDPCPD